MSTVCGRCLARVKLSSNAMRRLCSQPSRPPSKRPPHTLVPTPKSPLSPSESPAEMNMFRSLVEPISAPNHPAAHLSKKRYKLRWDWHLRNLLYSLIPPAFLLVVALVTERNFSEELQLVNGEGNDVEGKEGALVQKGEGGGREEEVRLRESAEASRSLLEEVEKLRAELLGLKEVVAAAEGSRQAKGNNTAAKETDAPPASSSPEAATSETPTASTRPKSQP